MFNAKDPITLFETWFKEAQAAGIAAPEAMTLATVTQEGLPAARVVLFKEILRGAFAFYTNYHSRKARELDAHPRATLLFFWEKLGRQLRIDGKVERVTAQESDHYFATRDRGSQVGAWASNQSHEIASREELISRVKEFEAKFEGKPVPRPPNWGGYRVIPELVEFWQAGEHRLHDRALYERQKDGSWRVTRLSP